MDFDIAPCSVCNQEDGLYFCKLCSLRYCAEHLCLHLNVAWESNTWTTRNSNETCLSNNSIVDFSFGWNSPSTVAEEQSTKSGFLDAKTTEGKTLLSFTEKQLEDQLRFYQAQAKRIRNELERRAFATGEFIVKAERNSTNSKWKVTAARKPREREPRQSKAQKAALEWLAKALEQGRISKEQLSKLTGGIYHG